ncbi:isoaspartyl peptidase/L-asparaginase [Flaviaesturariibacter flavus]|uniref:Isoaspartyl peptidase n=1 Tax=Flaviaesturariibacter flavus TaxID=2502780 RepID=A0A4R1B6U2_9BACT|nr:isoaspartyl peptidase/L-asparaginase [Flaviaesturariibacter flavus]TCJ12058.1 isoaspartyl peptidase/L-asparaginase [Flaviaesturariibacter flavus]
MKKFALAVHGGAGPDSDHIRKNMDGYKKGIDDALNAGYKVLEKGGSALDAVEAAVNSLEDNPLFNAGRGAAINDAGEVQMCSSICDGKKLKMGSVALVRNVRNPVSLAREVMEKTKHISLGAFGALEFAKEIKAPMEPDAYFITEHQFDVYLEEREKKRHKGIDAAMPQVERRAHGTVGAVALDTHGNLAVATSTGGTEFEKAGRIGDSSMAGIGSYADNRFFAVSTTGEGESLIRHVTSFHVAALMEYKEFSLQEACDYLIDERCKDEKGDMGILSIDTNGEVVFKFNSDRMHRGCKGSDGSIMVGIY